MIVESPTQSIAESLQRVPVEGLPIFTDEDILRTSQMRLRVTEMVVIEPGVPSFAQDIRELWQFRELIVSFFLRDVSSRYRQTLLGLAWAVIQPLGLMIVITVFIGHLNHPGQGKQSYSLLSYSSILVWQYFTSSITRCSNSLLSVGNILNKVYFPRLAAPCASVISPMVDFIIAFAILLLLLPLFQCKVGWTISLAPLFLLQTGLAALGIGIWASALHVRFRDMYHILPFGLQLLFFASPVLYSSSVIPEKYRLLYNLNPMVGAIDGFRWAVTGEGGPIGASVVESILVSSLLLTFGVMFFRWQEPTFVDHI